jgi:hypothetical protein
MSVVEFYPETLLVLLYWDCKLRRETAVFINVHMAIQGAMNL